MSFASVSLSRIGAAPLIVSGAVVMSASTLLPAGARSMLVLPLALLLPGWALLRAVTGSTDRRDPGLVIGLSAMLSIALLVLIALAMSAASVPLHAGNFIIGLDVALAGLAVFVYARGRRAHSRAARAPDSTAAVGSRVRLRYRRIAVAVALVAVLGGTFAALLMTYSSVRPVEANENPWIHLALVGPTAHSDAVQTRAPGQGVELSAQVSNRTRTVQKVTIFMQVDGSAWRPGQSAVVGPSGSATEHVTFSAPRQAGLHHIVLAIHGSPGLSGANIGTWIRVVPPRG